MDALWQWLMVLVYGVNQAVPAEGWLALTLLCFLAALFAHGRTIAANTERVTMMAEAMVKLVDELQKLQDAWDDDYDDGDDGDDTDGDGARPPDDLGGASVYALSDEELERMVDAQIDSVSYEEAWRRR